MLVASPVLYLLLGFVLGKLSFDFKALFAMFLTRVVIPIVIVFNVATHFSEMGTVLIATGLIMMLMLMIGKAKKINPVDNICFAYLNIGWLGLPIASTLFGAEAATIIISAYIGNSIVGNSIGASVLSGVRFDIKKFLTMPPVISLLIGLVLLPVGHQIAEMASFPYEVAQFLMSFLGMTVLGMWLSTITIHLSDIAHYFRVFVKRAVVYFFVISLLVLFAYMFKQQFFLDNMGTLYLFCLLPPAANIIVLETHYLRTGFSAKAISCGTCISIVAISLYVLGIIAARHLS